MTPFFSYSIAQSNKKTDFNQGNKKIDIMLLVTNIFDRDMTRAGNMQINIVLLKEVGMSILRRAQYILNLDILLKYEIVGARDRESGPT